MVFSSERIFFTLAVRMLVRTLFCCRISRLTLSGRSSRVDDAADEAEVLRQQLLGVVHDEDALDVELDAALVVGLVEIERGLGRDVEERGVLERAFGRGVEPEERVFPVAGDGLVELLVVFVLELGLGAAPHGAGGVDLLGGARLDGLLLLGVPLALVVGEEDGEGDVVGVLLDDLLQAPAVGVLRAFFVEVDEDGGAGALARASRRGSMSKPVLPSLVQRQVLSSPALREMTSTLSATMKTLVEADAELADEVGVLLGVAGELREEVLRAGAGDGAEVRDEVFLVHADAGVGDGEGLVRLRRARGRCAGVDAIADERLVGVVGEGQVAQLVERVGGVGDQLAQEDLGVRVEGMDDELEELADFGLKFTFRHTSIIAKTAWGFEVRPVQSGRSRQKMPHDSESRHGAFG